MRNVLLLLFVTAVVFANAIFHPFVHDDIVFIVNNPGIRDFDGLGKVFLAPLLGGQDLPVIINQYYRPVLTIFDKMRFALFGLDPHFYHLSNVILHFVNGVLVYALIFLLISHRKAALGAALLFLIHPVQSEAVAAVAGISNILMAFFLLLSFVLYVLASQRYKTKGKIVYYSFSLIAFILSLFTKEQSAVFPAIIFFYEVLLNRRSQEPKTNLVFKLGGFGAVVLGFLTFREIISGSLLSLITSHPYEFFLRLKTIPYVPLTYLRIVLFPSDLHYYRCVNILEAHSASVIVLTVLALTVFFLIKLRPKEQACGLFFGLAWFVICLFPVLNIIPIVVEYSYVWMPEHNLYLPSIGLFFFLGCVFVQLSAHKQKVFELLFAVLVFVFSFLTIRHNEYWKSEVDLFSHAVKYESGVGRLQQLLGRAYYFENNFAQAEAHYRRALAIMEGYRERSGDSRSKAFYLNYIKEIHFDLAHCYENLKDYPEAIEQYKAVLRISPQDHTIYNNIGTVHLMAGDFLQAQSSFQKVLSINHQDKMAMNNLAFCFIQSGEFQKAKEALKAILKLDPQFTPALENLRKLNQDK